VKITVFPSFAKSFNMLIIKKAVKLSSPDVGSNINQFKPSKRIIDGSVTKSTAIDVLFLSPPDIPFTNSPP
jgi:hypothetical protein